MIDFSKTFPFAENYGFKFINQRAVVYKIASSGFTYTLSKHDVIDAINYFISEIHSISKEPFKGDGMNFKAFKMYDLVPYLYTLINLYLTRRSSLSLRYYNWLPLLTLDRFCHMPFDNEILFPKKEDREIKVLVMQDLDGKTLYVCALRGSVECSYTFDGIKKLFRSLNPWLFDNYNVTFVLSDGSK